MRAVFFGTPDFAVPSLTALLDAGVEVPLVVTQPDRPVGRHAAPLPSAVARAAEARGIPVEKPERLRGNEDLLRRIGDLAPDVGVVVAYGKLLPNPLLALPRLSFVNVHASLLPKYRGASPIQAAILAGDRETGVVTMRVVEELDAGPIYRQRRVPIGEREGADSLTRRLAAAGGEILVETLHDLADGSAEASPQKGEPSYCKPIRREDGEVDWTLPAVELERRLRAYTPWPGLFTFLGEERVKILAADAGPGGRTGAARRLLERGGPSLRFRGRRRLARAQAPSARGPQARQRRGLRAGRPASGAVRPNADLMAPRPVSSARVRAVEVLRDVLERGGRATPLLARASRGLSPQDGDLLREIVLGVLRQRARLDAELSAVSRVPLPRLAPDLREILEVALYQVRFLDRVPAYAAVDEAVAHAKASGGAGAAGLVNAVLRNLLRLPPLPPGEGRGEGAAGATALALRFSHPEFLVQRWLDRFGETTTLQILEADNSPSGVDLMTNTRKTDRDSLAAALLAEGVSTEPSSALSARPDRSLRAIRSARLSSPPATSAFRTPASQALPLLLPPGETLVDLAAAPGGKSFSAVLHGQRAAPSRSTAPSRD